MKGPGLKIAQVSDLHGRPSEELYVKLREEKPDAILVTGDLVEVGECGDGMMDMHRRGGRLGTKKDAISFLQTAVRIAPVFYSLGNHEWGVDDLYREDVKRTGAVLLENEWIRFRDVYIGGQNSAKCGAGCRDSEALKDMDMLPETGWLKESPEGYRILLCHHPEYYDLVKDHADLVLAGHAHGGQWRFFGRSVFAPGQGFFPCYSKGIYGKMIVSAGLTNTAWVPRINNPVELVIIEIGPDTGCSGAGGM